MGVKAQLDLETPVGTLQAGFWQKFIWQICDWRPLPQKWRQKLRKRYARKVVGPFDVTHDGMNCTVRLIYPHMPRPRPPKGFEDNPFV